VGKIGGTIFGILFGLAFGGGMVTGGYFLYESQTAAQDYKPTSGAVVSSSVSKSTDDDGTQYSPEIVYTYTVEGEDYKNDSYYYIDFSTSNRGWAEEAVKKYSEGDECKVFYSPENPQYSVLVRDPDALGFLAWVPYILMGVGGAILLIPLGLIIYLLLMAGILFNSWKESRDRGGDASPAQPTPRERGEDDDDSSGSGGIPTVEEM